MVRMIAQIRKLFTPRDKKRLLGISLLMALAAFGEMLGLGLLIGVIAFFLNPELLQKYSVLNSFWHWTNLDWQNFVICGVVGVALLLGLKNIFALFVFCKNHQAFCVAVNSMNCLVRKLLFNRI